MLDQTNQVIEGVLFVKCTLVLKQLQYYNKLYKNGLKSNDCSHKSSNQV